MEYVTIHHVLRCFLYSALAAIVTTVMLGCGGKQTPQPIKIETISEAPKEILPSKTIDVESESSTQVSQDAGPYRLLNTGIDRYTLTHTDYSTTSEFEGYIPLELKVLRPQHVTESFEWFAHDIEVNDDKIQIDGITYGLVISDLDNDSAAVLIRAEQKTLNTLYLESTQLCDASISKNLDAFEQKPLFLFIYGDITENDIACINSYNRAPLFVGLESGNNATLALLATLKHLYHLDLDGHDVTDQGLPTLLQVSSLRSLSLKDTLIQDAGLETVGKMAELTHLSLEGTQITDAGLKHLSSLTRLTTLNLADTLIQGDGLQSLHNLSELRALNLYDTLLNNDGAASIGQFSNLRFLNLGSTRISSLAVSYLKPLKRLRSLDLRYNDITDDIHLETIRAFNNLETLILRETDIYNIDFISVLKQLKHLDIGMTLVVEPETIKELQHLRYLRMDGSRIYSLHFLKRLFKLQFLDISQLNRCSSNHEYLKELNSLTQLRVLRMARFLSNSSWQGDPGVDNLLYFLTGMKDLKELDLTDIPIDGSGLRFLSDDTKLSKLNLSRVPLQVVNRLDDDEIWQIAARNFLNNIKRFKHLRYLKIDIESTMTTTDLETFSQLPNLRHLSLWTGSFEAPKSSTSSAPLARFSQLVELKIGIYENLSLQIVNRFFRDKTKMRALNINTKEDIDMTQVSKYPKLRLLAVSSGKLYHFHPKLMVPLKHLVMLYIGNSGNRLKLEFPTDTFSLQYLRTSGMEWTCHPICDVWPGLKGLYIDKGQPIDISRCTRLQFFASERELKHGLKSLLQQNQIRLLRYHQPVSKKAFNIIGQLDSLRTLSIQTNLDMEALKRFIAKRRPLQNNPKLREVGLLCKDSYSVQNEGLGVGDRIKSSILRNSQLLDKVYCLDEAPTYNDDHGP